MDPSTDEERFAEALRALTDLHGVSVELVACAVAAERAFADGLRVGDQVRRAVRQGRRDRPGGDDVAAIEAATARLREIFSRCLSSPEVDALRCAIAAGVPAEIAAAAIVVYTDLVAAEPAPVLACRGLRLRRRSGGFETLVAPARLVVEIEGSLRVGDLGRPGIPGARAGVAGGDLAALIASVPEPLALDPGLDGCGSEVALAWRTRDLGAVPLLCRRTGEIWTFGADPSARAAVAIAPAPEDEWWTASEIPWRKWADELANRLRERGIEVLDYSSSLPQ